MKELKIEADKNNLNIVLEFIDGILKEAGCSVEIMSVIDIAVEEIFVNVSSYAYAPITGEVTMRAEVIKDKNELQITFLDSGVPFDPLQKEDPDVDVAIEDRPVGGLGVYMVKMSMDKVEYEYKDGANVLSIVKNLDMPDQ